MTTERSTPWRRVARSSADHHDRGTDRANFLEAIAEIRRFIDYVRGGIPVNFTSDPGAYGAATTAVIRAASLFERDGFARFLSVTPEDVRDGLRATRNIAAHAGYTTMDDRLFWTTVTVELPDLLDQWEAAARRATQ